MLVVLAQQRATDGTLRVLSRVASSLDDQETALRVAQLAVRRHPGAANLHALSVALLRTPGREQSRADGYFQVLDALTPGVAAQLWSEIGPIANAEEQKRWQAGDLAARGALLRKFWDLRAGLAAEAVAERLA